MMLSPIRPPVSAGRPAWRRLRKIFLILFALPFCLAGGWLAVAVVHRWLVPGVDCRQYPLLLAIGLVFTGAGIAVIVYALRTGKSAARLAALRALHPEEPWLWREDWGAGTVEHSPRCEAITLWLFALGWNGVTIPLLFLLPREVVEKGNRAALFGFLFPVVGAGLLIAAIRATRRSLRHGASRFEMARVPGVVGGRLEGRLHARLERAPGEGVRLVLTCVRRTMAGSGRHRAAHESIAWQEEATVPPAAIGPGPLGVAVPVSLTVPYGCEPTDLRDPRRSVHWVLRAEARPPGIPYRAAFEVPAFRTRDSDPSVGEPTPAEPLSRSPLPGWIGLLSGSRIRIGPSPRGGTELHFGAARNPGVAFSITVLLALLVGVIWVLVELEAPAIFTLLFGAFAALIAMAAVELWLGVARVRIEEGRVEVRRSWLGVRWTRSIAADDVTGVGLRIGMQHGGSAGTPYYDLVIHHAAGRPLVAARHVRSKRDAERLVSELKRAIGVRDPVSSPGGAGDPVPAGARGSGRSDA